jgi:NAD(P)-dependent dehydrogenase (short-subunit alcohol dehydrogenase family)
MGSLPLSGRTKKLSYELIRNRKDSIMTALNLNDLTGRVVLITGACGALGRSFVEAFAAAGASVAAADLATKDPQEVYSSLPGKELHSAYLADVSVPDQAAKLVGQVVKRHGHLDILVNSAGILEVASFLEVTPESFQRTLDVNLSGSFLIAQEVARQMVKQGTGGRIILVSSNIGRIPRINNVSYAVSKAGVNHLVRCIAMELGKYNITANALCPGSCASPMLIDNQAGSDSSRLDGIIKGSVEQWRTGIPLGRLAFPEEQAAMAVFLASEGGRFVSGQTLCVDGGQTYFT